MRATRRSLELALAATLLGGCGGGDSAAEATDLFVSMGSLQCTGGGTPLPEWERRLTAAGVQVLASSCGMDGQAHATVCGAPDGRIAIVQAPSRQAPAASALGFVALSTLPGATRVPCP